MKFQQLLLIGAISVASMSTADAASMREMKDRTAVVATRYLKVWSSSNVSPVSDVPYMYGRTVLFYGKHYTQADLKLEKRRAISRWPARHYAHRPGSMRVHCSVAAQRCTALSTIDFAVANLERGTRKSGAAKFALGISFAGPHPVIFYEGGSLNNRRSRRLG
jgi:hypothetical protein